MKQLILIALLVQAPVWAAGPLLNDDAGITPLGQCQLESGWSEGNDGQTIVMTPACSNGVEYSLSLGRALASGQSTHTVGVQAKTPLWSNNHNIDIAGTIAWQREDQQDDETLTANVPISVHLTSQWDALINIGAIYTEQLRPTAGFGLMYSYSDHLGFFAESHKTEAVDTEQQFGVMILWSEQSTFFVTVRPRMDSITLAMSLQGF